MEDRDFSKVETVPEIFVPFIGEGEFCLSNDLLPGIEDVVIVRGRISAISVGVAFEQVDIGCGLPQICDL